MNKFKLNDLFHLTEDEMRKYKIHLAAYNGYEHPLDVFARDREEWKGWNEWRGGKDDFNRRDAYRMMLQNLDEQSGRKTF